MVRLAGIALSVRQNRWEREMEYRSAVGVGLKLQTAAMGLDNGAANRKPDSHAVAFCRHEGLEDALSHVRANSRPAVGNREFDEVGAPKRRRYPQFAPIHPSHRLQGIAHQVDQDLLNFNSVRHDMRRFGIQKDADLDPRGGWTD